MNTLAERLINVRENIRQVAAQSNRNLTPVKLLAVSKTFAPSDIEIAYRLAQRAFGENYVQEFADKVQQLAHLTDIEWHFIGPLQANKSKIIAQHAHWLHTLDRLKIAQRLNEQRPSELAPLNVLIQVNISNDPAKSGIPLSDVAEFAQQLHSFERLQLRGLMAIPAVDLSESELTTQYQQLAAELAVLQSHYPHCTELSIGMSNDMHIAIAQGATIVRIGTAIFGKRDKKV